MARAEVIFQNPSVTAIIPPTYSQSGFKKYKTWLTSRTKFILNEPYYYTYGDREIMIPSGFMFDGASVPRPFWSKFSPTGVLFIGSIIHDYAYDKKLLHFDYGPEIEITRKEADKLFKRVLDETNGLKLLNYLPYWAVRLFGRRFY